MHHDEHPARENGRADSHRYNRLKTRAAIFDAYGTLFDVVSLVPQSWRGIANLWRRKQLEYTWLRSLMERYEDFWTVTESALRAAVSQLKIPADEAQIESLMQAYLRPPLFPDARTALEGLSGLPLAILSNGSPRMLDAAVRHNGLQTCFAEIISVDRVKTYKPSPRVYALGPEILKIPAKEMLFVSSNWWDAAGAKAFGYQVCWSNRAKLETECLGFAPDLTVAALDRLPAVYLKER